MKYAVKSLKFIYSLARYNPENYPNVNIDDQNYLGLNGQKTQLRILSRPNQNDQNVMIIFPGASPDAEKHTGLLFLASIICKLGYKVIVPRIPPLKELKLDHECYDWFAHAYGEILLRNDVDKDKVSSMALSFGGGLLLKASLDKRIIQTFGSKYSNDILEVINEKDNFKIFGFVGSLNLLQRRRGGQYIFLNGRYIEDLSISKSIRNCYDSTVQRGEFPFYVLNINLPTNMFDINVHPTKIEARFDKKLEVTNFVTSSIKIKLRELFKVLPDIDIKSKTHTSSSEIGLDLGLGTLLDIKSEDSITDKFDSILESDDTDGSAVKRAVDRLEDYENSYKSLIKKDAHVWQIHNKYLITEITSGILVIDQHVAHERVLYEEALKAFESTSMASQTLLFPEKIDFSHNDFDALLDVLPYLEKIGFKIKKQDESSIQIDAIPSEMALGNEKDVIREILDNFIKERKQYSSFQEGLAAMFACKAAIKAGDSLMKEEMQELVNRLFSTEHPYYCPHGRPIIVQMSLDELDARFERH